MCLPCAICMMLLLSVPQLWPPDKYGSGWWPVDSAEGLSLFPNNGAGVHKREGATFCWLLVVVMMMTCHSWKTLCFPPVLFSFSFSFKLKRHKEGSGLLEELPTTKNMASSLNWIYFPLLKYVEQTCSRTKWSFLLGSKMSPDLFCHWPHCLA